ncbi:MAG: peptidylprolyl isomerase [Nanoarchaeota archaeon]
MKRSLCLGLILLLFLTGCGGKDTMPTDERTHIVMETSLGTMEFVLYDHLTPITADNFKRLVNESFFDGQRFHRVIKNFMVQGGDPLSKDIKHKDMWGTGSLSYTIPDEFVAELKHTKKGLLSMANHGPNTGSNQFFITLVPTPWLDGKHAIFGELISGEDVLDKIGQVATDSGDRPITDVMITKVYVK